MLKGTAPELRPSAFTGSDEAGCFVGDGALPARFRDVGYAAFGGVAGELRAVHTTAPATLNKTARMSIIA